MQAGPPAVLLGGDMIAVSAARSLARAGAPVYALGDASHSTRRCRHCTAFVDVGSRPGVQDRYLEWLERRGPRGAVVLPCHDEALELVARHRPALEDWGYRPIEANDEVVLAMLDKERTGVLAREAGVPTPRTATIATRAEAADAAAAFDYPCALKPLQSHVFARHFGILAKVVVVDGPEALQRAFERLHSIGVDVLVTEIVPGGDDQFCSYYSYLSEEGEPLFHFTKRKLRQWPTGFGLACYQVTNWDPEVVELGLRFFRGVGLRGVGNVEFKRDARDGTYKLIECNHRFTAANELVRAAGIDIPLLAYSRLVGRASPPVGTYRRGLRMWHPLEDARAFRAYREAGELTTGRWVRSLLHRQHFPMASWDDPMPTLASIAVKLRRLRRRLLRRRRSAGG